MVELSFQIIYTIEMLVKILALGFFKSKYAYIKDNWNILDFLIVMVTWGTFF